MPYQLEIANFYYPLSFSTLIWGDCFQIYQKVPETRVFQTADSKYLAILA